jgi:hypothetical protein
MTHSTTIELQSLQNKDSARDLQMLQTVAAEVDFVSDGVIYHAVEGEIPLIESEIEPRFQLLPPDLQQRYITLQLRDFLHSVYFRCAASRSLDQVDNPEQSAPLINQTIGGPKSLFFQNLHERNRGKGYFEEGWLILDLDQDGLVRVCKQGLTLWVDPDRSFRQTELQATAGDLVAIKMPSNRIEKNAYVAVGDAGPVAFAAEVLLQPAIVEVSFSLKFEGAAALMQAVTEQFNSQFLPFVLKTPHTPEHYQYCDAVVLRLLGQDYPLLEKSLQQIYADFQPYLRPETPFFTRTLAPGVAIVERPHQSFTAQEDFGYHCCHLIALELIESCQGQTRSVESRRAATLRVLEHLQMSQEWVARDSNPELIG